MEPESGRIERGGEKQQAREMAEWKEKRAGAVPVKDTSESEQPHNRHKAATEVSKALPLEDP
jgi:hypothetical protein